MQWRTLDPDRSWSWVERLSALCDVAEGVAQIHALGYVHGDLFPDNIFSFAEGEEGVVRWKVGDFGNAETFANYLGGGVAGMDLEKTKKYWYEKMSMG